MISRWLRWMPAVAVPAVIAAGVLAAPLRAGADAPLPDKTPAEVLALAARHEVRALSGTLEQGSDLGLPQLPQAGPTSGPAGTSILELLATSHTARVYADGPDKVRVQVMDRFAERDLVRNGNEVWIYTSRDNTATHVTLPGPPPSKDPGIHGGTGHAMPTPEDLAKKLLASVDPTTTVQLGPDVTLAGRSAYQLVLSPKATETLIESAAIYVDGQTGLPLGVELKAREQADPAFRVAFTELTLGAPDASLFQFTPPPGATIKEIGLAHDLPARQPAPPDSGPGSGAGEPGIAEPGAGEPGTAEPGEVKPVEPLPSVAPPSESLPVPPQPVPLQPSAMRPRVIGSGWDAVVELPAAALQPLLQETPVLAQAFREVPGGRLLSTSLVNVLLTDDGRALIGSVTLERLRAAASTP